MMTKQELSDAIQMHDSGVAWSVVAAYFKTTTDKLRKQIKHYEQADQRLFASAGKSREGNQQE